ncbi:thioredoxin family protein [Tenacibaculum sp. IB213877]|uniref:thioredoxin family protein n=1 Tax=Tenacibaculum sp. IB213877 TaxID=3097351 RepID=UPI002A5A7133|nr:thioredoxin family protein [Tenacibaculum sp. IB213877]MDY0781092.1 thioredoxin family protein [Tenacibaculum sp. IB213877]
MRKFVLGILMMLGVATIAVAQENETTANTIDITWEVTFKDAVKKARKERKPILIYFTGSDWCGPCMRLDKDLFHTEKFKQFADENMILYMADYPRNRDLVTPENKSTNEELSARYAQTSFPTLIMINDKGEVLGRKNGSYMTEYYYPFFEETIKRNK